MKDSVKARSGGTPKDPVSGGCWQQPNGGVIQPAVTNGLYMLLSARLYKTYIGVPGQLDQANECLDYAYQIYKWFKTWMREPPTGNGVSRIYNFDKKEVCLNSTGICTVSNDPECQPPGCQPLWLICSAVFPPGEYPTADQSHLSVGALDQGILMAGLTDLLRLGDIVESRYSDPSFKTEAAEILTNLDNGARTILFWPSGTNKQYVLQDMSFNLLYNTGSALDLSNSKGLFMRFWMDAVEYLKPNNPGVDYDQYVQDTAQAVWNTQDNNQLSPNWAPSSQARSNFIQNFTAAWAVPQIAISENIEYTDAIQAYDPSPTDFPFQEPNNNWNMAGFVSQGIGLDALTAYVPNMSA